MEKETKESNKKREVLSAGNNLQGENSTPITNLIRDGETFIVVYVCDDWMDGYLTIKFDGEKNIDAI